MRRRILIGLLAVALILGVPALAPGHPERTTKFPDLRGGGVPRYRNGGPTLVVCKRDSLARVRSIFARGNAGLRRQRLAMLRRCRYRNIQAAVNDARSGDRFLIMPGVYEE